MVKLQRNYTGPVATARRLLAALEQTSALWAASTRPLWTLLRYSFDRRPVFGRLLRAQPPLQAGARRPRYGLCARHAGRHPRAGRLPSHTDAQGAGILCPRLPPGAPSTAPDLMRPGSDGMRRRLSKLHKLQTSSMLPPARTQHKRVTALRLYHSRTYSRQSKGT